MKRYELLEYTQFTKNNKDMSKEIRESLMSFLQTRGYNYILNHVLKTVTYGELREELMTVLDPPARVSDIYKLIPWKDNGTTKVFRWFIEIDPIYLHDVQIFLETQVTAYTFPLVLVEDVDVYMCKEYYGNTLFNN